MDKPVFSVTVHGPNGELVFEGTVDADNGDDMSFRKAIGERDKITLTATGLRPR